MREEENLEDNRAIDDLFPDDPIKTLESNSEILISNSTLTASSLMPSCYYSDMPSWKIDDHFEKYSEEILFYIFYSFPDTDIQIKAYNRLMNYGYVYSETLTHFIMDDYRFEPDGDSIDVQVFDQNDFKRKLKTVKCDRKFYNGLRRGLI